MKLTKTMLRHFEPGQVSYTILSVNENEVGLKALPVIELLVSMVDINGQTKRENVRIFVDFDDNSNFGRMVQSYLTTFKTDEFDTENLIGKSGSARYWVKDRFSHFDDITFNAPAPELPKMAADESGDLDV